MRKFLVSATCLTLPTALLAASATVTPGATPAAVIAAAPAADWLAIAPSDLLVMDLAADAAGRPRRVVIQLMPEPFARGWVQNIRKLVAARWFDGIAVVRVQDNYVVQWGDPDGEVPAKAKPLPAGLTRMPESAYTERTGLGSKHPLPYRDAYAERPLFYRGFPFGAAGKETWPLHCYGMVGVGRNLSPDTGTGAELYTVIGQAPRQLDRNIAVVGRVIAGIEHLSSLPRGTGDLGFYKTAAERTPIASVRLGSEVADLPAYQYLSTDSASFAAYVNARANRKDDFYFRPAGGVEICNVPVPVRESRP